MNSKIINNFRLNYLEYFIIAFILFIALFSRFYKINNPIADWHSWRQADTASVSRTYVERGVNLLFPRYHDISTVQTGLFNPQGYRFVEFPIFNLIHTNLFKIFPLFTLEVWGRLLSIYCTLVSLVCVYLLGKRYLGTYGGLVASFFFAVLPYNMYFTRVILPEPMATMFGLLSLLVFTHYIETDRHYLLLFSGLFLSLGILTKPFIVFFTIPMLYLIVQKYGIGNLFAERRKIFTHLLVLGLSFLPFFIWRAWIGRHPEGIPFFTWVFNGDRIRFKPSFWRWIFGERLGILMLGAWGMLPFGIGILTYKKANAFIHWFLISMFVYVSVVATANVRHDYYQTITVPAISLMLSCGFVFLWQTKIFNRLLTRGLLIFSLCVMLVSSATQINEFYKINHPEIIEAGIKVDQVTPKDALIIAPYNGDTAFLYQTKRWGWPYVDRPLQELIEEGANYYVSVNYDNLTNELMGKYQVVAKTQNYIIINLRTLNK